MFARDFWRTSRWHTAGSGSSEFIVTSINHDNVSTAGFRVRWTLSEPATGQVEYGTTTSYGSTTTEETDLLDTHIQWVSGLNPSTLYHYRVKSTAGGSTIYSDDQTVTTEGDPVPTGWGVRYGLYGDGASGGTKGLPSFPVQGVALAGHTGYTAGAVKVVPSSISDLPECSAELQAWLRNTTNVPDGANAATPTVVVFDNSGGGSAYGTGTQYDIETYVGLDNGDDVVRSNIMLWGYNSRIKNSAGVDGQLGGEDARILLFNGGGYQDWSIAGFWLRGGNSDAGTDYNNFYANSEKGHAIGGAMFDELRIWDVYGDWLSGDFINIAPWSATSPWHWPSKSVDASEGGRPGPTNIDIRYCHFNGAARQGIMFNQGRHMKCSWTIWENTGIYPCDLEDREDDMDWSIIDLEISDCLFRNWNWLTLGDPYNPSTYPGGYWPSCLAFSFWGGPRGPWTIQDIFITRNRFEGGARMLGNPDWESIAGGQAGATDGYNDILFLWTGNNQEYGKIENLTVTENVCALPENQDRNETGRGYFVVTYGVDGMTIADNVAGNLGVKHRYSTGSIDITDISGTIDT